MRDTRALPEIRLYSVWLAGLAESAYQALGSVLDAGERERAKRFRWAADRHAYVAAHALLRHALCAVAGAPPHSWTFRTDAFGKPHVSPDTAAPGLAFSLSHTRGMALVGVAKDMQLGVDVERPDPGKPFMEIAECYFHPREVSYLRGATTNWDTCTRFTTLWTVKEAYLKAVGTGLSQALDIFAFDPGGSGALSFGDPSTGVPGAWRIWTRARDGYHQACLARPLGGGEVRIVHAELRYNLPGGWQILDRGLDPSDAAEP